MNKLEKVISELALFDTVKVISGIADERIDFLERALPEKIKVELENDIYELRHLIWAMENLISAYASKLKCIAESEDQEG